MSPDAPLPVKSVESDSNDGCALSEDGWAAAEKKLAHLKHGGDPTMNNENWEWLITAV